MQQIYDKNYIIQFYLHLKINFLKKNLIRYFDFLLLVD